MARALVVKVTCGSEDAERCNQAFTVAATAAAAGAAVSLWLTGEAAWFGVPRRPARRPARRGARDRPGDRVHPVRRPPRDRRGRRAAWRTGRRRGPLRRGG